MSTPKVKTIPDLSLESMTHMKAIQDGTDHFHLSSRNVKDEFKSLSNEEIRRQLKETAFPYAVLFENWLNDFNMATGVRNANAFNARQVYYIGNKKIDRRGMCGTHNYTDVTFLSSIEDLISLQKEYTFVGVDNIPGSVSMSTYTWLPQTLLCFGEEGVGLTPGLQALCKDIVHINQYGSVRSINCGTASGITMFDYINKVGKQS